MKKRLSQSDARMRLVDVIEAYGRACTTAGFKEGYRCHPTRQDNETLYTAHVAAIESAGRLLTKANDAISTYARTLKRKAVK